MDKYTMYLNVDIIYG